MEVKEALQWFEWADDVYYCSMPNASPNNEFYKQSKEIKNLLKSMEAENKKLKKENKALRKDKWELEGINEACRRENEAYEGMWKEFKKGYSRDGVYFYHDCSDDNDEYVNDVIRELEQTYLGGGE